MPGLAKVIVLDPDSRAGRQIQLGFEREGVPTQVLPVPAEVARLELAQTDTDEAGLIVVGGKADGALALLLRVRELLDADHVDAPVLFAGGDVRRSDAERAGADECVLQPAYLRDVVTIGRLLRTVAAHQRNHIGGNLAEMSGVLVLVRALSALGRSAVLTLIRGLRRGEVRFFEGEVTSAQVGLIHGQAALHQLLLWTDARFEFHYEDVVRRQQIPLVGEELWADAERFLAGVRDAAGQLSPSDILEQDVSRLHSLGKQIPTEVHGVLRMFDGHRMLADVLEDSPYRVFETLRVTQRAVDAGLLRVTQQSKSKASWRAVLAIEEWLVGAEAFDPGKASSTPADAMPVVRSESGRAKRESVSGRPRTKRRANTPISLAAIKLPSAPSDIDWGQLVPRTVGAEVGPLAGVVPAAQLSGEIRVPTREAKREKLETLMDTGKRERIFPRDIGMEPSIVFDDPSGRYVAAPGGAVAPNSASHPLDGETTEETNEETNEPNEEDEWEKVELEARRRAAEQPIPPTEPADDEWEKAELEARRRAAVDGSKPQIAPPADEDVTRERVKVEAEQLAERLGISSRQRELDAARQRRQLEIETKARREAEIKAAAEARAIREAEERAAREEQARKDAAAAAEAEAKAKARAQAEADARARRIAKQKTEAEQKAKREAELQAKAEADAKLRAEADAKALADAEAKRKAALEAEAIARIKRDEEARQRAEADRQRREAERIAAEVRAEHERAAKAAAARADESGPVVAGERKRPRATKAEDLVKQLLSDPPAEDKTEQRYAFDPSELEAPATPSPPQAGIVVLDAGSAHRDPLHAERMPALEKPSMESGRTKTPPLKPMANVPSEPRAKAPSATPLLAKPVAAKPVVAAVPPIIEKPIEKPIEKAIEKPIVAAKPAEEIEAPTTVFQRFDPDDIDTPAKSAVPAPVAAAATQPASPPPPVTTTPPPTDRAIPTPVATAETQPASPPPPARPSQPQLRAKTSTKENRDAKTSTKEKSDQDTKTSTKEKSDQDTKTSTKEKSDQDTKTPSTELRKRAPSQPPTPASTTIEHAEPLTGRMRTTSRNSRPLIVQTPPVVVEETAAATVTVQDSVTIAGTEHTAQVTATPLATIREADAVEEAVTNVRPQPLPRAPELDAPVIENPIAELLDSGPASPSSKPRSHRPSTPSSSSIGVAKPAAEPSAPIVGRSKAPSTAPAVVEDEPSDGVVLPIEPDPPRALPPPPKLDVADDRPPAKTGEISSLGTRKKPKTAPPPPEAEPSILVNDLANAHSAIAAVATQQAAAAPTRDAKSAQQEALVSAVRKDATGAFTKAEEDFFREGHELEAKHAVDQKHSSFDDLDEGYEPVGLWDRLRGKKPKKPKR